MELEAVSQIIGSFGFPIFACIVMGLFLKYVMDGAKEERKESQNIIVETINNNTLALNTLCNKIDFINSGKGEK